MSHTLRPLTLIYNQNSGFYAQGHDEIYEQMMALWSEQGFEIQSYDISSEQHLPALFQQIIARHLAATDVGVVVAAGGDGTLNAVAQQLMHSHIPMGILPMGTFNFVARVLNIPLDLMEAAQLFSTGHTRQIHIARINDHIYLNNASLGLYPLFIQRREQYNQKIGRFTVNAYSSALDVLIRDRKELKLEVILDNKHYPIKTPLIFFGNNQLQLEQMNLQIAKSAEQGKVAGVVLAKSDKLTLFKSLLKLVTGKLESADDVYSFDADQVVVKSKSAYLTTALDGEIVKLKTPLTLSVDHNALNVMVPYVDASV